MEPRRSDRLRDDRRNDLSPTPPPSQRKRSRSRSPRERSPPSADDSVFVGHETDLAQPVRSDSTELYTCDASDIPGGDVVSPRDLDTADAFTLVTYRKNRPQGIPVLFKPVEQAGSFWKVNPNVVAKDIRSAAQEPVIRHRVNSDGSMCIFVQSEGAVSNLLALRCVAGIDVNVSIPSSYVRNQGKINDVPLAYSNDDLVSYLASQGVTSARRQVRHVSNEDGSDRYIPLRSVILTFRSNQKLPPEIYLGFSAHRVKEYVEGPIQCFHCQRFGHLARNCRWPQRCKFCAGPHGFKECTARRQPKCANCGGPHVVTHSQCPHKLSAIKRFQASILSASEPAQPGAPSAPTTQRQRPHLSRGSASRSSSKPARRRDQQVCFPPLPDNLVSGQGAGTQPAGHRPAPQASYADVVRRQSKGNVPKPDVSRRLKRVAPAAPSDGAMASLLLPLVLAAVKAIVATFPAAAALPEVQQLLAAEGILSSSHAHA